MIKKQYNESILLDLKKYLDRIQYHLLLTIVLGESTYFTNPLPDYKTVKSEIKKLDLRTQKILSFFLLGEPIEKSILDVELKEDVIDYLYSIQIINQDNTHYWFNNFVLTSYCNCYFIVSNVFYYPTCQSKEQHPYIGFDSYWLSRTIVNRVNGRVLDLCTGSGIQAILSAKVCESVVAIDIDEESAQIAMFNAFLNDVSNKIDIRVGDLYNVLNEGEKFDYIISNPPFIPIPDNIDFHKCGDGGVDGADIIRKILKGYKSHLLKDGQAIMIGQCIGTHDIAFIENNINECIEELETYVITSGKTTIENQAIGFSKLAEKYNETKIEPNEWMRVYDQLNVEYFYNFTLFVSNCPGEHRTIHVNDTWSIEDVPQRTFTNISEFTKMYSVKNNKNQSIVVDEETATFLRLVDNSKTLGEIIALLPLKFRLKYGSDGMLKQKVKFASSCSLYERQGIIEKPILRNNK